MELEKVFWVVLGRGVQQGSHEGLRHPAQIYPPKSGPKDP